MSLKNNLIVDGLLRLANHLDNLSLYKEAEKLDQIAKKAMDQINSEISTDDELIHLATRFVEEYLLPTTIFGGEELRDIAYPNSPVLKEYFDEVVQEYLLDLFNDLKDDPKYESLMISDLVKIIIQQFEVVRDRFSGDMKDDCMFILGAAKFYLRDLE